MKNEATIQEIVSILRQLSSYDLILIYRASKHLLEASGTTQ